MHSTTLHTLARRRLALVGGALAITAFLSACADDTAASDTDQMPSDAAATEADALSVTDPWAKATDTGMTAAFGEIDNTSTADVRIVSAETDASPTTELHTMEADENGDMMMTEVEGGFIVPAAGSVMLEPGGDHIMIMGVTEPIEPGADVTVTLTLDDGSTIDIVAPARSYSGANESYGDDSDEMDHDDMDMSDESGDASTS